MSLSNELISQFVKATANERETSQEATVYGTTVEVDGKIWVKLDGSDVFTPISSTADAKPNERVTVMIKDHTATITGNMSSPSARTDDVKDVDGKVDATIRILESDYVKTDNLEANYVTTKKLETDYLKADQIAATYVKTDNLEADYIKADQIAATYVKTDNLEANYTTTKNLEATYATIANLKVTNGQIENLETNKLSAKDAEIKYANIDFANIKQAGFENFYSRSGMVEYMTTDEQVVTGILVGVTIKGDIIDAGTIVADKLVFRGDDGLYYKLNTEAFTDAEGNVLGEGEYELTDENGINGRIIVAKSIAAEKVSVSDLVAFDATIGGMNLRDDALYSGVKDSVANTTPGFYMDKDGQVNFGDETNYLKFFQDEDGNYRLVIAADTILYSVDGSQHSLSEFGALGNYVRISTYEDEPCIELGQEGTDFKMVITNKRILFMEGADTPAYMTNQSLHITKAVIEEELKQGGFLWQARANGNLGLVWKGVTTNGNSN